MNRFQMEALLEAAKERERQRRNEALYALFCERKKTGERRIKGLCAPREKVRVIYS